MNEAAPLRARGLCVPARRRVPEDLRQHLDELLGRGVKANFASRADLAVQVARQAREGDLVLVMGARDPSLTDLARAILQALGARAEAALPRR